MDSKEWVEVQAPTVEEAIILGLTRLGITREDATVQVVDEGSQGFLGLGAREARVRVRRQNHTSSPVKSEEQEDVEKRAAPSKPKAPEAPKAVAKQKPAAKKSGAKESQPTAHKKQPTDEKDAKPSKPAPKKMPKREKRSSDDPRRQIEDVVLEVGSHLFGELDVQPKLTWKEEDRRPALWLLLEGDDAEDLVGHHGKTLNAAQFLMRVLVRSRIDGDFNLIVDANDYRWRRYGKLKSLAHKMAKKAVSSGQPVRLRPMPARERRIVHMTLRDDDRVRTKSYGSGRGRAVTIFPMNSGNH